MGSNKGTVSVFLNFNWTITYIYEEEGECLIVFLSYSSYMEIPTKIT